MTCSRPDACDWMGAVETGREAGENLIPGSSRQIDHTLEVVRLWEQVDQVYVLDPVTTAQENNQIAGQRRRIA